MLLSVIIPTCNRSKLLADLLDSLCRQDAVSFDWEILVVDNGSTDDTALVVHQKSEVSNIPIKYIFEPRLGLHYGRHRGAKEADGLFLGYLDDDMVLAPTWIQGVNILTQGLTDAVVGRILPQWEGSPPQWLLNMLRRSKGIFGYLGILDLGTAGKEIDPGYVFGGNFFISKKHLFELGGFHPDGVPQDKLRYRGDGESALMAKLKQKGYRAYYDPNSTVWHIIGQSRQNIEYICKRAYNQGISDSFTTVRKTFAGNRELKECNFFSFIISKFKENPKDFPSKLIRRLKRMAISLFPTQRVLIERKISLSYRDGYSFHQAEIRNDPQLLEWVLKKNFIE